MKRIVDIATVLLLAAAFILAYYTGFVSRTATGSPVLATNTLSLISVVGVAVLFAVGGASTAYDRFRRRMVTRSFLAFFIVQILGVVGMAVVMLFISLGMFTIDNTVLRMLYIVFAMISVLGYVDAMLYSDSMAAVEAEEEEQTEEELEELEEDLEELEDDLEELEDDLEELEEDIDELDEEDE